MFFKHLLKQSGLSQFFFSGENFANDALESFQCLSMCVCLLHRSPGSQVLSGHFVLQTKFPLRLQTCFLFNRLASVENLHSGTELSHDVTAACLSCFAAGEHFVALQLKVLLLLSTEHDQSKRNFCVPSFHFPRI